MRDAADPLVQLVDEGRVDRSGQARGRERMLRQLAEEGATFRGTLLDLAERGSSLTIRTEVGRAHHGVVAAVGADFCLMRGPGGTATYLRTDSIAVVRPRSEERHAAASGDRTLPFDQTLADLLAGAAPERPRVLIVARGGELVSGTVRAVGDDVVTVALDGDPRSLCYLSIDMVVELTLT